MTRSLKQDWFSNIKGDLLSGIVVALALIPEAIAFSIIAGVDPKIGLYASFSMAVIIAFAGGRPGMISAATGAMALLMVTLVKEHGLEYLLAATLLTGALQIVAGYLRLADLMRFVSRSVVTGFVNALAILIFMAQLPELTNVTWHVYAITLVGLGIIYGAPWLGKITFPGVGVYLLILGFALAVGGFDPRWGYGVAIVGLACAKIFSRWVNNLEIPSPLLCIVLMTGVASALGLDINTVGDMGELPDTLPVFLWPDVPLNLETLSIIFPYAIMLTVVGLLESMMTATIVDDLTDTESDKNRECKGQGMANIGTGLLGGMAGCAMIGQSVINIKSGGRGRLSTLFAGVMLLIMVVFLADWVSQIPMAALVAVMIMVSIGTFSWTSIRDLKQHPMSSNLVMLATVAVTVGTHNLAMGVFVGVLLAALFFANKVGNILYIGVEEAEAGRHRVYRVVGQVFFASSERFGRAFDFKESVEKVTIDLSRAHFWDITAVQALDRVVIKFRREGTEVELVGLNEASATIVDRYAIHDDPEAVEKLMGGH
ncbi:MULTISPECIES: SulP family inorganic anion transporter [Halomonas]|uniref:Sodium-independent anion transporter n=1 Tax=Halomonas halophila TaxID=29573 RepID=A0ABQ0U0Q8_9GAMM|nr:MULTISPECIES: SulP family inorganic anion transporter [Halomonas]MDR5888808.1 SulP family inorganic anion transporter [Halomonas salina]WJY07988.1 SulP family inorganic anion transporter [Halomonas halophila]GEK72128.1 sodium-independent anion transporter [Halomonas halophila]